MSLKKFLIKFSLILIVFSTLTGKSFSLEPEKFVQTVVDEATFILPVADVIDIDQEKARLAKEIENLDKEIGGYDKKLSNQGFLAKAPADVVETQKERREEAAQAVVKLKEAAARLSAL